MRATETEISRYHALKRRGGTGAARLFTKDDAALFNPRTLPAEKIVWQGVVPVAGQMSRIVRAGQTLRLVNTSGQAQAALIAVNADLPSERLNTGDTAKIQWNAFPGKGRLLYSDMGRVLFSITEDTCGHHDLIVGGTARKAAPQDITTRDNLILAMSKFGLGRRDVVPCVNFFAGVDVDPKGELSWRPGVVKPGAFVDLRAEMNVLVALSNTRHPLAPVGAPGGPLEVQVWQSPPAAANDPCRTSCEEAERAFDNTRDFLAQIGL